MGNGMFGNMYCDLYGDLYSNHLSRNWPKIIQESRLHRSIIIPESPFFQGELLTSDKFQISGISE
jgi:hypothetical protein